MNQVDRMRVVGSIKRVDQVVLSVDTNKSVVETLESIYNEHAVDYHFDVMVFANGGDVNSSNSNEESFCKSKRIKTVYNVGGIKTQSSSELLKSQNQENPNDND